MDILKIIEKTKQVATNVERGYTQSVYGTLSGVHKQMEDDIHTLVEIVSVLLEDHSKRLEHKIKLQNPNNN